MKQGCLSWNTNTLLTLCVCVCVCVCVWTAPWVRMTAEPWGGKATSPREEASFHPCSYQKISLKILRAGKVELRNWKDVGLPRPRQCPAPERTRQYQVQGRAGQHKLPPLPLLKYFSSWLGKLTKSARVLFDLGKSTKSAQTLFKCGKMTSQYFKLRETRSTLFFSVYQTWVNRKETYHSTRQLLLVQYFWAWDACYWSKKGLRKPNLDQGNGRLLEVIVKLQVLLLDQSCFRSWQL